MLSRILITSLAGFLLFQYVFAQDDDVYRDMSLEELFDVEVVVTASKKPEDLFETPLSVTIIKQAQIIQSGATSIPGALRLAPGLIVREQTPGNYDVHIRGFDDVTTSFIMPTPTNSIILVMIDNRVVYDYFAGGTFWETLPIDINDVERIEIVRGPASALYGPNAVVGVINIITSHAKQNGLNTYANAAFGTINTKIANASIGYNWNDRASFGISGNYMSRNRFDDQYYSWARQEYVALDSVSSLLFFGRNEITGKPLKSHESGFNPHYVTDRALYKYGMNLFFDYVFFGKSEIAISSGTQRSMSQKAYYNNFSTPLSEYDSKTYYFDLKLKYKNYQGQFSVSHGKHDNNWYWNKYDFKTIDGILEYDWQMKKINLRPGISFRKAEYSGMLISDEISTERPSEIPEDKKKISSASFFMLADYRPLTQLRLISGYRVDKYNLNRKFSRTYQACATYRFNKNNLGRFVFSKANRAPFMLDSYIGNGVNVVVWLENENSLGALLFEPNKNTDYLTNHTFELGWRIKAFSKLKLDLELFASRLNDFIVLEKTDAYFDSVLYNEPAYVLTMRFNNTQIFTSRQRGIGFNFEYNFSNALRACFYGTFQNTHINYDMEKLKEQIRKEHEMFSCEFSERQVDSLAAAIKRERGKSTPAFYGGFRIDYSPLPRLSFNINAYRLEKQVFIGINPESTFERKLDALTVVNAGCSFRFWKNASFYMSARNILGKHCEYGFTDNIDKTFVLGIRISPTR